MTSSSVINHEIGDTKYTFKDKINCKTNNVVYGVICMKCKELKYVGETGTTLYERTHNHLTTIRKKQDTTIAEHFNMEDHRLEDFTIIGIEQIKNKDIHLRKIRESFWIKRLQTLKPKGLNMNLGIGDTFRV